MAELNGKKPKFLNSASGELDGAGLDFIETWIFDLDNTLYPATSETFGQVEKRIGEFVQDFLGLPPEEAYRVQKDLFVRYGTTLRGLMEEHGAEPDGYLDYVHDIDLSSLTADPALREGLKALSGKRYVFTNAEESYSWRVLDRIGLADLIDGVFDVVAAGLTPKPAPVAYERLVSKYRVRPETTIFIEDMARNLVPAHEMGMTTVWLNNGYKWGPVEHNGAHIHYEIEDLAGWLAGL